MTAPAAPVTVPAVARMIHFTWPTAPGRCFAAIITSVSPGHFEVHPLWPAAFRMGAPQDLTFRDEQVGLDWHWPMDKLWHEEAPRG